MPYPWDALGLDGPAGEADIRRAYARKLKTIDLTTDGEAFQDLVAARAQALRAAAARGSGATVDSALPVLEEAGGRSVQEVDLTSRFEPSSGPAEAIFLPDGTGGPNLFEPGWAPADATVLADGTGEQGPDLGDGAGPGGAVAETREVPVPVPSVGAAAARDSERSRLEMLGHRLWDLAENGWDSERAPEWDALLDELALLPLGRARLLEPAAIDAAASLLLTPERLEPLPWRRRWRRMNRFRRESRYKDPGFLRTVLGLATLYGWFTSDQALWDQLDPPTAGRLLVHLRAAHRAQAVLEDRLQPGSGAGADVALPRRDLAAMFQEDVAATVAANYDAHVRTGRWPISWNWAYFIMAPVAMLFGHMKPLLLPWVVLLAYVLAQSRKPADPSGTILIAASLFALAALHGWVGAYWYRGSVRHAQRLVTRADRFHIFDPDLRWTFLSGRSPDRAEQAKSRWTIGQRAWRILWLVFTVIAVLRLLAATFGVSR